MWVSLKGGQTKSSQSPSCNAHPILAYLFWYSILIICFIGKALKQFMCCVPPICIGTPEYLVHYACTLRPDAPRLLCNFLDINL